MANVNDYFRASTGSGRILTLLSSSTNTYTRSTHGKALMIQVLDDVTFSAYTHNNASGVAIANNITFPAGTLVPCDVSTFTISAGSCIVYLAGKVNAGFTTLGDGIKAEY